MRVNVRQKGEWDRIALRKGIRNNEETNGDLPSQVGCLKSRRLKGQRGKRKKKITPWFVLIDICEDTEDSISDEDELQTGLIRDRSSQRGTRRIHALYQGNGQL